MGYWDATDRIIEANGGCNPSCPQCRAEMYPLDDHGRFACSNGCGNLQPETFNIPQVDTSAMSNAEKAQVEPLERLFQAPTDAEANFFMAMRNAMSHRGDSEAEVEYVRARAALEAERKGKT